MSRNSRLLLLGAVTLLAATAVRLGVWQLDRLSQRRASNRVELAARDLPVLDLGTLTGDDPAVVGRVVRAEGEFLPGGELLLRNRAYRDAPGVHVVTPFRVSTTGAVVWILRGFVNAANGVTPAEVPAALSGPVTVRGVMAALPVTRDGGRPVVVAGDTTWQRLDSAVVMARLPGAIAGFLYLDGGEGGPGGLAMVEPPALGEGPHLSYAIQWFGIAVAIVAFGIMVSRRRDAHSSVRPPGAP